ncbi:MAG: extracellular solute-binding protein, partial [Gammaproteobacteria bacterium]
MGTWDSFNNFVGRGRPATGVNFTGVALLLYDRWLEQSADEPTSQYLRLAAGVAVADDFSWVQFKLRDDARWHDGEPITVDDAVFTFNAYKEHGSPAIKTSLMDVERIEVVGPGEVRYVMKETALKNASLPLILGQLPMLPEHYWRTRDVSRTTVEPPLGSGPYRVGKFVVGRYVEWERVKDYWGKDLPVNRGRYNFDMIKFDYFRDEAVMREAHKGDALDVRQEGVAKMWATAYDFPAINRGLFKRELVELHRPEGLWWPVFWNLRLERFQDIRVREALWWLYDFQFINRVLMFGFYDRGVSYFQHSEFAQSGLPSADELALLEPWREQTPARVFTQEYRPPDTTGFGPNREHVKRALELFAEAGWVIEDGVLRNVETGEPFRIDFIVASPMLVRSLLPYVSALRRIGIDATERSPEVSKWLYRMRSGAFDGGMQRFTPSTTPGFQLLRLYGSASADIDFGQNWAGVKNPVVDALIGHMIQARSERELVAATRAFDRVMLWNFYHVPGMVRPGYRLTYWDRYGKPQAKPLSRPAFIDTWWWDP